NVKANKNLINLLQVADRATQYEGEVEDENDWPKSDLVIVGPPYYNREDYGVISTAAVERYKTYNDWINGFLTILLQKSFRAANRVIINVAELRQNQYIYDLPKDAIRIAETIGAHTQRIITWNLARFGSQRHEKLIVFEKQSSEQ